MKQLLIFFILFSSALFIDLNPVNLSEIRNDKITVSIEGEVYNPGEYSLHSYAILNDLLYLAKTKDTADLRGVNPNLHLKDNDRIVIPSLEETALHMTISINSADAEQLCKLPGIGENTALHIIAYREENGFFQTKEELMNVKGIGQSKYEKIADLITL